jgi:hypothetical protein
MYTLVAYTVYLALALLVVVVVGRILFVNGRFYLVEIFHSETVADIVNRFLYAGYCLVNAGGAFRCLAHHDPFASCSDALIYVAENQGQLLLLLGVMHTVNLSVLPLLKNFFKTKFKPVHAGEINTNH